MKTGAFIYNAHFFKSASLLRNAWVSFSFLNFIFEWSPPTRIPNYFVTKEWFGHVFLYLELNIKTQKSKDFLALFSYLSTFKILIFSFFKRNAYATRDTTLSNAFPMPNSNAMPMSDGVHTPVI